MPRGFMWGLLPGGRSWNLCVCVGGVSGVCHFMGYAASLALLLRERMRVRSGFA